MTIICIVSQAQSVKHTYNTVTVASTTKFGISVLVSGNDCDKQPSYEYCGERDPSGFRITVNSSSLQYASINLVSHL